MAGIETPRWKAILAARRVCIFTARFVEWPIKEGEQFCIFPAAQRRVMTFPND
jgi:putative SOS response-associated peptidase YedK